MQINKINNTTFGKNKVDSSKIIDLLNKKHILQYNECKKAEQYNQTLWNQISDSCLNKTNTIKPKKNIFTVQKLIQKIKNLF